MSAPSVLLAASFAPAVGGIETLLYQTSRRLAVPPLVLAPQPAAAPDLPVWAVRTTPAGLADRAGYRAACSVHPALHYLATFLGPAARAVRAAQPRVLQAGHVYLAPLAWLLARRARRPFVVYAYGQEVWRAGRRVGLGAADRLLRGRALQQAAAVLVPGTFTAGLVRAWGVPADRVVCVPFGAEPRPPAAPPQGAGLLSVGRLVPRKGVDAVLRALPGVARAAPEVAYRVVGSGPDEPRLRDLAASQGVADRVRFLGRLGDEKLAAEYRRCALFVLPARRTAQGELEGLGLVYFEAAAWGRAAVAGRSGGEVDAVVDGVTGRLIDGTSADALTAVLVELLGAPERLRSLGEAARRRVETSYTWSHAAAAVDDVLARVARG